MAALWIAFCLSSPMAAAQSTSVGSFVDPRYAGKNQESQVPTSPLLLKGQVTYVVPRGTAIKLKLSSVPSTGLRLLDRDLDGNLPPAQLDQEITCKTTEDLYVEDNKVIPEGTVFHGKVSKIIAPGRIGRAGSVVLSFDHFTTPDGRRYAFCAEATNYKEPTGKSRAKEIGMVAAYAAGGAVTGALLAYQIFGLAQTISMHGYNIAGGAAAGALGGTAIALLRRGSAAVLEPGDDMTMSMDTDLLLPAASEPAAKVGPDNYPGIEVEVVQSKVVKDGLGGRALRLELVVSNDTDKTIRSMDLFVEDDNGHRFPIAPGLEEESEICFHVEPHSLRRVVVYFELEFPKLKRKLVWVDPKSQKDIFTQKLP